MVESMYVEHPVFATPEEDAVLWRYMDFTKYVSLLQLSALHFARVDLLGDPFEGSRSRMNPLMRPALYQNNIPDEAFKWFDDYSRMLRTSTFINCWHESTHESAALWKLYAQDGQGIAMQTTCGRLKECLKTEDKVYIGRAEYVDFDNTFISERNSLAPFTYKRREYAHEHEVRAVVRHEPDEQIVAAEGRVLSGSGLYYSVSLDKLIHHVRISPYATDWFTELVQSVTASHGLRVSVQPSSLSQVPL